MPTVAVDLTSSASRSAADAADEPLTHRYFELQAAIEHAKRRDDYAAAIAAARETLGPLPRFVAAQVQQYGRWDIQHCHAIHISPW